MVTCIYERLAVVETALISFLIGAHLAAPQDRVYRIKRSPVGAGAELVTVFEHPPTGPSGIPAPERPLALCLDSYKHASNPGPAKRLGALVRVVPCPGKRARRPAAVAHYGPSLAIENRLEPLGRQ